MSAPTLATDQEHWPYHALPVAVGFCQLREAGRLSGSCTAALSEASGQLGPSGRPPKTAPSWASERYQAFTGQSLPALPLHCD